MRAHRRSRADRRKAPFLPNRRRRRGRSARLRQRRRSQGSRRNAACQRNERKLSVKRALQGSATGAEGEENACLAALFPEEKTGGVGREHSAAEDRQHKDHHDLLAAVTALWQHVHHSRRAHHQAVGGDEGHREKAAKEQQRVAAAIGPAQTRLHLVKIRECGHDRSLPSGHARPCLGSLSHFTHSIEERILEIAAGFAAATQRAPDDASRKTTTRSQKLAA